MAFQTTSYICALSTRERLLLPLVLGLRRWARVGVLEKLISYPPSLRPELVEHLAFCLWFRSVTLIAQRKVDCHHMSSPSWSSSSCNSAGKPFFPLTWNKRWGLFIWLNSQCNGWMLFPVKWIKCSFFRSRFFRSAGCLSFDSHMWRMDTFTGSTRQPQKNPHSLQKTPLSQERWLIPFKLRKIHNWFCSYSKRRLFFHCTPKKILLCEQKNK